MPLAVYFPYVFDWGYAVKNVITSKKFYNIGHWDQRYKIFKDLSFDFL
jgi:hypothetical protein